jgi:hypothetical protein
LLFWSTSKLRLSWAEPDLATPVQIADVLQSSTDALLRLAWVLVW